MGERLGMLDTMFLELEEFDETAYMLGAAGIFDPLPATRRQASPLVSGAPQALVFGAPSARGQAITAPAGSSRLIGTSDQEIWAIPQRAAARARDP